MLKAILRCAGYAVVVISVLVGFFQYRRFHFIGPSSYGFQSTADEIVADISLEGKTAVITGATSGLGFESARALSNRGARVFLGGRSAAKAIKAVRKIKDKNTDAKVIPLECDLSDAVSVKRCAETLMRTDRIDIAIWNAGVAWVPEPRQTRNGFEVTVGVNHLGHFYLTDLIKDRLLDREHGSRVVVVSSSAHSFSSPSVMLDEKLGMGDWAAGKRSFLAGVPAYGDSKLANVLFARELHHRYGKRGLLAFSLNPGGKSSTAYL